MAATNERVALVTGANRGIGLETCRQLAGRSMRVLLTGRSEAAVEKAAGALQQEGGGSVIPHVLDVTSEEYIERLRQRVASDYGRLDVLINNAGVYLDEGVSVFDVEEEVVRQTMEVNFYGPFRLCRAFLPMMVEQGYGRVVNVTSGYGQISRMGGCIAAYKVSKAALNALTRIVASEVHGNVKVNAVDPGWVGTRMGGGAAPRPVEEAAGDIVWAATLSKDGPHGALLYKRQQVQEW